ncbi:hypothetical protein BYT27DRAFT_6955141 [Phlegmacium glaucopus]|nr:hypothetical protein BYT27DRAFT_6955141 [Phlegmacium glaucopus]
MFKLGTGDFSGASESSDFGRSLAIYSLNAARNISPTGLEICSRHLLLSGFVLLNYAVYRTALGATTVLFQFVYKNKWNSKSLRGK